uniref:5-demethoxyubiquinone hydroxylase, mitochondrial n=1 Tax=Lutzomyia longipalpis TaxID=7200 RepID=A0A7G3AA45_LUTLO
MSRVRVPVIVSRRWLHKRPTPMIDEIIRVDHAGELGADRIYAGQMAVLGNSKMGPTIQHMWDQEKEHRRKFEVLINEYRVRPTVMTPFWNVAGFALGAGTALLGEKAAMACTVAVETVIVDHYNDQLRQLMADPKVDQELLATITKFRDEEQEHHDTGIDCGAEQAPFYRALTEAIKFGSKAAIAISKKKSSFIILSTSYLLRSDVPGILWGTNRRQVPCNCPHSGTVGSTMLACSTDPCSLLGIGRSFRDCTIHIAVLREEVHVEEDKKEIIENFTEIHEEEKLKLDDELSKKKKYTKSLLCPGASTPKGGLSTLREFQELLERDVQRSELQKAGLTAEEQDLFFKFRQNSSLPDTQSFRDRLAVINEKIEDFFKTDEKNVKLQHPMDALAEMEKVFFDDLKDIPSLRKRRKMMIKEEKKLEKILNTPARKSVKTDEKNVKLQHPMDALAEMEKVFFDDLKDIPSLRKRRKMMIKEEKKLEKILNTPASSERTQTDLNPGRSRKSKWDQR